MPLSLLIDEIVQRHDARQLGDVARERAHVMVGAGDLDLDRQLGVELFHLLLLRGLEELELQAAPEAGLVDVGQQRVDLGAVGQLLHQRAEGLLDLVQLLHVELEVDRLGLLLRVLVLELDLLAFGAW